MFYSAVMTNKLKITTIGNSMGLILQKEILEKLRVKKGDTLWRVAQRTGVPMSTIIRTNSHLIKRRSILPGDKLAIR